MQLRRSAILQTSSSWRLTWSWKTLSGGITTHCAATRTVSLPAARYAFMVLGGPLANVIFAIAVFVLGKGTRGLLSDALSILMLMSLLLALGTLIPATGKLDSDGRVLCQLAFHPTHRNYLLAKLTFNANFNQFQLDFNAGRIDEAASSLPSMRAACHTPREDKLRAIVEHLQSHVDTGESLESCQWTLNSQTQEQRA